MKAVFCDTSALYALLDRSDAYAPQAANVWLHLSESQSQLTTTNYVVLESTALLQTRIGIDAVRGLRELVEPLIAVHFIESALHQAALEQVLTLKRRRVSLVDLTSFSFMRQNQIARAFAFDRHFEEFGFTLVGDQS